MRALVIGSSGGLGSAFLACLAESGYSVIAAHSPKRKPRTGMAQTSNVESWIEVDLRDPDQQLRRALTGIPPVDGLVFCAGAELNAAAEEWADPPTLRVNATALLAVLAALPTAEWAVIVGSAGARRVSSGYSVQKRLAAFLTAFAATSLSPRVRALYAAPGWMRTPMLARVAEARGILPTDIIDRNVVLEPDEVAAACMEWILRVPSAQAESGVLSWDAENSTRPVLTPFSAFLKLDGQGCRS